MANKKLDETFDVLDAQEIIETNDIQKALSLINQTGCISDVPPPEMRKFAVEKKKESKELSNKLSLEDKTEDDLEEIANQADSAFYELMDISINSTGKGCADIASAANSFLTIKLNAKMAKIETKYKKLNYELQAKKVELASKPKNVTNDDEDDDDEIIVVE